MLVNDPKTNSLSLSILESIQDGIVLIDEDQLIQYCNEGAEIIFGFVRTELIDQPLTNLMPPRYRRRHPQKVKSFSQGAESARDMSERPSLSGLRSNGDEFPIVISIAKIEWDKKNWSVAVIRDVTRSRHSQTMQAMRREYEQLQTESGSLLAEIKLLRAKDGQTEQRLNELAGRIADVSNNGAEASGGGWQDLMARMSIAQKILAILAGGMLMIAQGASVGTVVDLMFNQIGDVEQLEPGD